MGHVPEELSRDFAAALTARELSFRAVSVPAARCFVPRGASLRQEYRRKVRTITRGIATLAHKRALLNPLRYGVFAWMLFSHKVCRWLVPCAALLLLAALSALALTSWWALGLLVALAAAGALAGIAWAWPEGKSMPRLLGFPAYVVAGNQAALLPLPGGLTPRPPAPLEAPPPPPPAYLPSPRPPLIAPPAPSHRLAA